MISTNIYTPFIPDQYCVYHTTYSGNLLPQNYIGSTSTDNVLINNYHGSVASKRYKSIWLSELKLHPELFSTLIVSFHDTRSNATWKELQVQRTLNVVKSDLFINRSYANSGFGDTTYTSEELAERGKKQSDTCTNRTPEQKASTKQKQANSVADRTSEQKASTSKKMSAAKKGKKRGPHSEQHKINQSIGMTGIKKGPQSEEHIAKKSVALTGSKRSDETKSRMSASQTGKKASDETRAKQSAKFFSLISTKTEYTKSLLSRYFPEFKQYY